MGQGSAGGDWTMSYRPWRYRLNIPFYFRSPRLAGVGFFNRWLTIKDGTLLINKGYAWDGCSPSLGLPGGLWLGPWDGPRGIDGRPAAFFPTLVHDALCQFAPEIAIDRADTVGLFADMLTVSGMPVPLCRLYVVAVDLFGPRRWPGRALPIADVCTNGGA